MSGKRSSVFMGDGINNKHALIINGDANQQHLDNMDQAMDILRSAGVTSLHVVSPEPPRGQISSYSAPQRKYLEKTVQRLARQIDNDDLLILYIQGHSGKNSSGESCLPVQDSCLTDQELDQALQSLDLREVLLVRDECKGNTKKSHTISSGQYFLSSFLAEDSLLSPVITGILQGMLGSLAHYSRGLTILYQLANPPLPKSYALGTQNERSL